MHNSQRFGPNSNALVAHRVNVADFDFVRSHRSTENRSDATRKMSQRYDALSANLGARRVVHFIQIRLFYSTRQRHYRLECCTQPSQCELFIFLSHLLLRLLQSHVSGSRRARRLNFNRFTFYGRLAIGLNRVCRYDWSGDWSCLTNYGRLEDNGLLLYWGGNRKRF